MATGLDINLFEMIFSFWKSLDVLFPTWSRHDWLKIGDGLGLRNWEWDGEEFGCFSCDILDILKSHAIRFPFHFLVFVQSVPISDQMTYL